MQNRNNEPRKASYLDVGGYLHEVVSAKALTASAPVNLTFFDGNTEALGTDYRTQGQNPFESGRGALMALEMGILGANGVDIDLTGGTTDTARLAAAQKLLNLLKYQIKRGALFVHKANVRSAVVHDLPIVLRPKLENSSSPANIVRPFSSAPVSKTLAEAGVGLYPVVFRKPIAWEGDDSSFEFKVNTRDEAYTVDTELTSHIIYVKAVFLEKPKLSTK